MNNWMDLIDEKIPNFNYLDVEHLLHFNYFIGYNEAYENVSYLTAGFLVNKEQENKKYELILKFKEVNDLNLQNIGGGYNQLMGFKINDIRKNNWEANKKYWIEDYENGVLNFYCKEIELISIKELI